MFDILISDRGFLAEHLNYASNNTLLYHSNTSGWGFNVVPSNGNPKYSQLVLECANFRRDKPELCLLMGDKRRNARSAGNTKTSNSDSKKQANTNTDGNPSPATKEQVANVGVASAGVTSSIPESGGLFSTELAKLQYQRRLQDLQYNLLGRHGIPNSPTRSLLGGGYPGLGASSLYGLGDSTAALQGEGGLASVSLYSIEREIQECLQNIAVQKDRLVLLQSMKELKVRHGTLGAGLGSLLQSGP